MVKTTDKNILNRAIEWRERNISERNFVLILSFLVGTFASIAAWTLKTLIHLISNLVQTTVAQSEYAIWYLLCPMLGIALSALFVKYIVKDDISHGITKILYAISQRKSIIKPHNVWSSIVGSSLTIGFGGSVGAEAPIVLTGAAIGSNLARLFRMDQKTMMLMIGCGAAGAIGGIFKAPIAGLVFTLEVLMIDMTMANISPLMISSITATAFTYMFSGTEPMFELAQQTPFSISRIPYYIILGICCGFVSLYFTRGMNYLETQFKRISSFPAKILIGGIGLGVLIFLFPPLFGEGYDTISYLLSDDVAPLINKTIIPLSNSYLIWAFLFATMLLKIVASVATNGGGGVGGIFAPSLFVGCLCGFLLVQILNRFGTDIPVANFALAGMAGVMAGVMHAPLTGMFLIAELTGSYHLFLPLMIVSVISYVTILLFEPHSLYAMRLAKKGELLTHNKDRSVLTLLKMEDVLETDLQNLSPDLTLGELVKIISKSKRNVFPVVNDDGKFLGILLLDEVRNIMFQPRLYNRFKVKRLMTSPPAILQKDMPMEKVMEVFEDTGAWNLPVVDENQKYIGFVSKSKIFNSYRDVLVTFSEE